MQGSIRTWIICPECRSRWTAAVALGRMTELTCRGCRQRFRVYAGDVLLFKRRRRADGCAYFLLLSGAGLLPRPFWFTDTTVDQLMIDRGDRILLAYARETPSVVQNLSLGSFWIVHRATF